MAGDHASSIRGVGARVDRVRVTARETSAAPVPASRIVKSPEPAPATMCLPSGSSSTTSNLRGMPYSSSLSRHPRCALRLTGYLTQSFVHLERTSTPSGKRCRSPTSSTLAGRRCSLPAYESLTAAEPDSCRALPQDQHLARRTHLAGGCIPNLDRPVNARRNTKSPYGENAHEDTAPLCSPRMRRLLPVSASQSLTPIRPT